MMTISYMSIVDYRCKCIMKLVPSEVENKNNMYLNKEIHGILD